MRLALSEGRLSRWEELLDELTPRQLVVLQAYYQVEPWGEARADLREAVMATSVAAAVSVRPIRKGDAIKRVESLCNYMGGEEPETQSPNSMAAVMRGAFPSRSK